MRSLIASRAHRGAALAGARRRRRHAQRSCFRLPEWALPWAVHSCLFGVTHYSSLVTLVLGPKNRRKESGTRFQILLFFCWPKVGWGADWRGCCGWWRNGRRRSRGRSRGLRLPAAQSARLRGARLCTRRHAATMAGNRALGGLQAIGLAGCWQGGAICVLCQKCYSGLLTLTSHSSSSRMPTSSS